MITLINWIDKDHLLLPLNKKEKEEEIEEKIENDYTFIYLIFLIVPF